MTQLDAEGRFGPPPRKVADNTAATRQQIAKQFISELIDYNLALRCMLAVERPELAHLPGPELRAFR